MEKFTERLGSAPLGPLLLKLALPSIAATITSSLYNIVDTFWVARLGHEAIAALTIVMPYQIFAIAVGIGTGTGINALVSRYFGANDIKSTNRVAGQIFYLSVFWGILFVLAALFFAEPILLAIGATPDIIAFATTYLIFTSLGAPAHIFILLVQNLIRGSGDAIKPTIIMISASVINIVLDPFMIMGIGPFPVMGIKGAALATVIAQSFGTVIALYFILGRKTAFKISPRDALPQWSIIKSIYKVGTPASIQNITESLAFILFNKVISGYGSIPIAAMGLALRVSDLVFMPIMGVSNALLPIVGFNLGAGKFKRIWKAIGLSTVGLMVMLAFFTFIIQMWTGEIIGIFINDPEVLAVAVPGMRIMLAGLIFLGPNIMFVTAFQGLSMGGMALFLSLVRQFLLFVPLLYLLRYIFGLTGVWLTMPISDVLTCIIESLFIYNEYRKRKLKLGANYQ